MNTDGGYGSPEVDEVLAEHGVELRQTAIRGRPPAPDKFNLADCQWELDDHQQPLAIITPQGERVEVEPGRQPDRYILRFGQAATAAKQTASPPAAEASRSAQTGSPDPPPADPSPRPQKTNPPPVLYFSQGSSEI